jgi:hypothetical protein
MSRTRAFFMTYDQRTGRKIRGIDAVYDGEIQSLLVKRGEDDPPHPLSQPFAPGVDRVMLLNARSEPDPDGQMLTVSEGDFTTSPWTDTNLTQTEEAIYAPNGTLTATKLLETADTGNHSIQTSSVTITSGTTYTASIYVKMISRQYAYLYLTDGSFTNYASVTFDASTGLVGAGSDDDTTATVVNTGVIAYPNGWYRIWIAASLVSSSATVFLNLGNHAGDTAKGFYVWGAKLERASSPTAYASADEVIFR